MVFGRIIDISRRISNDATVYPGDPRLRMEPLCSIGPGCPCAMTRLGNWSTHVLTHLDAPAHFIAGGASLDQLPLERFIGDAVVIEVSGPSIRGSELGGALDVRGRNILFKTSNSAIATEAPFVASHVFVTREAAERAVALGANMVGIDYLSVDRHGDHTYPAHYTLLGNNILILEGLDLSEAAPGRYQLSALPLKIAAADGSPVRAVLMALCKSATCNRFRVSTLFIQRSGPDQAYPPGAENPTPDPDWSRVIPLRANPTELSVGCCPREGTWRLL